MNSSKLFGVLFVVLICTSLIAFYQIPSTEAAITAEEKHLIALINRERVSRGLPPLKENSTLTSVAQGYSQTMLDTGCFSHSCGGTTPADRVLGSGYYETGYSGGQYIAENIAYHYPSSVPPSKSDIAYAHDALMNSEGHRKNILRHFPNEIGVGIKTGTFQSNPNTVMVTELFAYHKRSGTKRFVNSLQAANVDKDSKIEIISTNIAESAPYHLERKAQLIGWRKGSLKWESGVSWDSSSWSGTIITDLCIIDLNNDGRNEIITVGSHYDGSRLQAQIKVWQKSGTKFIQKATKSWYNIGDTWVNSVAVGDVDKDGIKEIVTGGSFDDGSGLRAQLRVWRKSGTNIVLEAEESWAKESGKDTWVRAVYICDIDQDGREEIITGGEFGKTGGVYPWCEYLCAQLMAWRKYSSNLVLQASKSWCNTDLFKGNTWINDVFAANLDGDSAIEIVTAGGFDSNSGSNAEIRVLRKSGPKFILEAKKSWQVGVASWITNTYGGNVDGEPAIEIVIVGGIYDGTLNKAFIRVYRHTGSKLMMEAGKFFAIGGETSLNALFIANVDPDSKNEIIVGGFVEENKAFIGVYSKSGSNIIHETSKKW